MVQQLFETAKKHLPNYDDDHKQTAWRAWFEGYALGKNVEKLDPACVKTARRRFERWWNLNVETDDE